MSRAACLRCGDFLEGAALPLCARCLDVTPDERKPVVVLPPPELFWTQLGPAIAVVVVGVPLAGWPLGELVTSAGVGLWPVALLIGCLIALIVVGLVAYAVLIPPFANLGYDAWKTVFLERLGLAAPESHARFALVFLVDVSGLELRLSEPGEVAALLETPDAIAFLSDRGTRLVVSMREVESVSTRRLWSTWPTRTATELQLADGRKRFVAFLEERTFAANRERARAFADRLARAAAKARS